MAYMSQEKKKELRPAVKFICKKYGVKGTLGVSPGGVLVLTIHKGEIDFFGERNPEKWSANAMGVQGGNLDVNPYWYHEQFTGKAKEFLSEVVPALNVGNHDNSQPEFDHFDVGWYVQINVGKWNKPYVYTAPVGSNDVPKAA